MFRGVFEGGEEALIFGDVIGLMADVLAERGNSFASFILNDHTIPSWAGIAARTAVAESDEIFSRRSFAFRKQTTVARPES